MPFPKETKIFGTTMADIRGNGKLLDIGCATGFFLEMASQMGYKAVGVEISDFASKYGSEKLGLNIINKELRAAKFQEASFDIVTLWDVIEHFPDPRLELIEINRILVKGGIIGIITPDIGALLPRILGKYWLELRRVPEHLSFFNRFSLHKFLGRCGFDVIKIGTLGKKFYINSMLNNIAFQSSAIRDFFKLISLRPFKNMIFPITINPLYKMLVFARKVADLPDGKLFPYR
jgi:SAM-dependent methyltransferase